MAPTGKLSHLSQIWKLDIVPVDREIHTASHFTDTEHANTN